MRTRLAWAALALFTWISWLQADGFIVIHDPPPSRPGLPPHRFPFAPLEVAFHKVDVKIRDQIATTSVDQEFYNPNDRELEGTYLFPVPKGAQIDKFTMEIGGKKMEAELMGADKARQIYEDIVRKHRDPALLEYAGRDTFKVRIYPIEARSRKRVSIRYTQVLKSDAGLVSYVYPLNTEKFSAQPLKTVSVKVEVETKRPLKTIYSPSHQVEVRRHGTRQATVGYEAANAHPDTDWQLYFSQEDGDLGVNLLTYQPGGEDGFFLLMATPALQERREKVVPQDIVFVLDTSGSMAGPKLEQARKALQFCVENLGERDRFEIIRFATDTEPLFQSLTEVTAASKSRARDFIRQLRSTGGTAIQEALNRALSMRPQGQGRPFVVIFLTDGLPTVGESNSERIVEKVKSAAGENVRVFCFGIGTDVNTHLLDGITDATRAFSQYVMPEEDIEVKVSTFFDRIKAPVLASPQLSVGGAVRLNRMHPGQLPDLYQGQQIMVVGRYSGSGTSRLTVEGRVEEGTRRFDYDVRFGGDAMDHEFIARLWATRRVGFLLDEIRLHGENAELKGEVTELARRYGIVTPFTSYLILEDEQRRAVPLVAQTMPQLREDRRAQQNIAGAYQSLQRSRSGAEAVLGARYGQALKQADNMDAALASGNREANRSLAVSAAPLAASSGRVSAPAAAVEVSSQQASRAAGGKTFFQNGARWVDSAVQAQHQAQRVRVQFASADYFDLVQKHPEWRTWLALGRNLEFVHGQQVYEVYE